jgi:uncharacterized protein YqhQ
MKPSGIGGQAVIEGIMMRNQDKYSVAVRKPDGKIEVLVKEYHNLSEKYKFLGLPIIRGIFNFIDSLVIGMSTLSYSAEFYEDPQEQAPTAVDKVAKKLFKDRLDSIVMAGTIILSIVIAVALFMLLPYFASRFFTKYVVSETILNIIEGVIRLVIFLLYVVVISMMEDIRRVYMYHGAEHKCINCIENGLELNVKNVRESSRYHKRCGTSFMFLVMFVSIVFFIFLKFDSKILQIFVRILLVPVIAGVSYEILKLAGRSDSLFIRIISAPGILMQKLTTKEPEDDMIEVAIQAVEAVFDWRKFREEFDEEDGVEFIVEGTEEIPEFVVSRSRRQAEQKLKGLMEDKKAGK